MKLQEKILYLRKKSGYSQEALAEKLGVSRQAVSKWENGDADPEISKLKMLAELFHVTTDWLLSDQSPQEENPPVRNIHIASSAGSVPSWVDNLPSTLGKLLKKYGWIVGVYIAMTGAGVSGMGLLLKFMTRSMFGMFGSPGNDLFGSDPVFNTFVTRNPVNIMASVFIFIGVVLLIAGVAIALALRKYSRTDHLN